MIGIEYDDHGLESRLPAANATIDASLSEAVRMLAGRVREHLKERAPVDDGELRDSLDFSFSGTVASFFSIYYGPYVIGGTAPHVIEAHKPPDSLHFFWDRIGGEVWFVRVHHPGTRPDDFRVPALVESEPDIREALDWLWQQVRGAL